MTINFRSDNEMSVASAIMEALAAANEGTAHSYGEDSLTADLCERFSDVFETRVQVWPLATGTAANALALAQICPPYGSVFCHSHSHLNTDECGAPEFFTAGAKLIDLDGEYGKLDPTSLRVALQATGHLGDHEMMPAALSLSQASEFGTVYRCDEIEALADVAHEFGLKIHMDGARFANAVASLGESPASLSWRAGVDLMSFGATKNGAMMAEALLIFDPDLARELGRRRKRAGHLISKMRFVSAQLTAYLEDDRWLKWAANANKQASTLAQGLSSFRGAELLYPVEANEIFVRLDDDLASGLYEAGFQFHLWPGTADVYRLVCAWCTTDDEVDSFLACLRKLVG
jgi:threonine aldolase